jgi:hypothetical protein
MKYLGLPILVWQMRRGDIQHLEEKMALKIPTWDGKLIGMAGHSALVKYVLASKLFTI